MLTDAESLIRQTFTSDIVDKLVHSINEAYQTNIPRYDPGIGDDMMLFGLMNYKSKVHNLSQLQETLPAFRVISRHPQFVMRVGEYSLSTYCAGHSSLDDPIESFPQNRSGAAKITAGNLVQMRIPLKTADGQDIFGEARCRNIVLADIGNPSRGLIRLFLGIPTAVDEKERICGWGPMIELFSADPTFATDPMEPGISLLEGPAVEQIVPPIVTLKSETSRQRHDS